MKKCIFVATERNCSSIIIVYNIATFEPKMDKWLSQF